MRFLIKIFFCINIYSTVSVVQRFISFTIKEKFLKILFIFSTEIAEKQNFILKCLLFRQKYTNILMKQKNNSYIFI